MSKTLTFILGAVLGLIIGGGLIFYLFGGVPRAAQAPGKPIQQPDPNGSPAGTANVVLNQQFFDTILATIFRDMNAPAFPLNLTGRNNYVPTAQPQLASFAFQNNNGCDGKIILKPEGSGVTTGVRLENGKISAPLAFAGSTSVFGQCVNFTGWAQANLALRYDESQQTVFGQINVETVNLDGVLPVVSGFVTPIVQTTINQRVNPIVILRGQQIALNLPIAATNGNLQAQVKDVRADVKDGALNLYVTYNFTGSGK
ncbi:MAG: hypothetical protein ACR2HG_11320 [Pyrinomonadaceae bacterium]